MLTTTDTDNTREITMELGRLRLKGDLIVPAAAKGIVVFAHGSGSSRRSLQNRHVASELRAQGHLGTLLFDLLTPEEEISELRATQLKFDIDLLAERVGLATDWLIRRAESARRRVGYFGASTGAAAALVAAAERPDVLSAIVSRGGRPDLAGDSLGRVRTPTLFIVGGADTEVLRLNRGALAALPDGLGELVEVPNASHLFEESGALDSVARHAHEWFTRYLTP